MALLFNSNQMPGGPLIAGIGSYLQLWNWSGGVETDTLKPIDYRYLDVVWANLQWDIIAPVNWHSGMHGALARRVIASDWTITCKVWFDYTHPPTKIFNVGKSNELAFKLTVGADAAWTNQLADFYREVDFQVPGGPDVINRTIAVPNLNDPGLLPPQAGTFIPIYVSPNCVFTNNNIIQSSEGDDYCTNIITLSGNSLLWYIDTQQMAAIYQTYLEDIKSQLIDPNL